jgi:hypothetical protein
MAGQEKFQIHGLQPKKIFAVFLVLFWLKPFMLVINYPCLERQGNKNYAGLSNPKYQQIDKSQEVLYYRITVPFMAGEQKPELTGFSPKRFLLFFLFCFG